MRFHYKAASFVRYECIGRDQNIEILNKYCQSDSEFVKQLEEDDCVSHVFQATMQDKLCKLETIPEKEALRFITKGLISRVEFSTFQMYELAVVYDDIVSDSQSVDRIVENVRAELRYVGDLLTHFGNPELDIYKDEVAKWLEFNPHDYLSRRYLQDLSNNAHEEESGKNKPVWIEREAHE